MKEWTTKNFEKTMQTVNMTISEITEATHGRALSPKELDDLKDCWSIMDKAMEVMAELGHDHKTAIMPK